MPFDGTGFGDRGDALSKIDEVIELLAREDRWCKQQLRSYDGRRCLLGAMMAADAAIVLKEPILLGIKQITGRDHFRIEMFNDHPLTTHRLVLRVLNQARDNLVAGVLARPALPGPVSARGRWTKPWERLRRVFA
jgi:hypothetical protein